MLLHPLSVLSEIVVSRNHRGFSCLYAKYSGTKGEKLPRKSAGIAAKMQQGARPAVRAPRCIFGPAPSFSSAAQNPEQLCESC